MDRKIPVRLLICMKIFIKSITTKEITIHMKVDIEF